MNTWIEINKSALEYNIGVVRNRIGDDVNLMAVVKSNAYGHGIVECAEIFTEVGADYLGVDSIEEGVLLRESGILAPIVILNPIDPKCADECAQRDLQVMAGSAEWINSAVTAETVNVHLKIDTGMGRQGVLVDKASEVARSLVEHPFLHLAGIATHYSCADDPSSNETELQRAKFEVVLSKLHDGGIDTGIVHSANSAATLSSPKTHYDMVRVGLALYGMNPFHEGWDVGLRPVLTWKTTVKGIKSIPAGSCVGYGCTELADKPRRAALIAVGYADGYDRHLSSVGEVFIRGARARIMGRISMNLATIDITGIPGVTINDEVILLGALENSTDSISAEELAEKIGTINYEITTRIAEHLSRRFI